MILGMTLSTFTTVHTVISLVAIATGLLAVFAMVGGRLAGFWTAIFLITTVLTSVTGFFFPATKLLPSHVVGMISLAVLAAALLALYSHRLAGAWRWTYVIAAVAALYLNTFVLVVQSFLKVSFLQPLAPTQSEPPFLIAQILVLGLFIALGYLGLKNFHPPAARV